MEIKKLIFVSACLFVLLSVLTIVEQSERAARKLQRPSNIVPPKEVPFNRTRIALIRGRGWPGIVWGIRPFQSQILLRTMQFNKIIGTNIGLLLARGGSLENYQFQFQRIGPIESNKYSIFLTKGMKLYPSLAIRWNSNKITIELDQYKQNNQEFIFTVTEVPHVEEEDLTLQEDPSLQESAVAIPVIPTWPPTVPLKNIIVKTDEPIPRCVALRTMAEGNLELFDCDETNPDYDFKFYTTET